MIPEFRLKVLDANEVGREWDSEAEAEAEEEWDNESSASAD